MGRVERMAEATVRRGSFVRPLKYEEEGAVVVAPAELPSAASTTASMTSVASSPSAAAPARATPVTEPPSAVLPPEFPRPDWRGTPVYGERHSHVVPASYVPPATAPLVTLPSAPTLAAPAIFPSPPDSGSFDAGATPQFGERVRPTWSGEVPPPPSTPPPVNADVLDSAGDDDDNDDDVLENKREETSDGEVVMVEDDDEIEDASSEWVLVEPVEDIHFAGTVDVDDTERPSENDENAAGTSTRAQTSFMSSIDATISAGANISPLPLRSPRSPELERLGVRANTLSPEQLNMEISKIKLAISSRKKLLGSMQTPSPLSWRQAISENADFS